MAKIISVYSTNIGNIISLELYWNNVPKLKHIGVDIMEHKNYYIVLLYEMKDNGNTEFITSLDFTTIDEAKNYLRKALSFYIEDDANIEKAINHLKVTRNIQAGRLSKTEAIFKKLGIS